MLIDTHCHLADFARRGDMPGVLDRAGAADIARVITIGTGPDDWDIYANLAATHPGRVDYTVGLHPCDIAEDDSWREQVAQLPHYFHRAATAGPPPVALGEIGLDRFHLPKEPAAAATTFARQEAAFRAQLALARELACPIVIHSRDAFADCVRVIDESGVDWRRIVFHCFTYGPAELNILRARGGRASFTGIITYKNAAPVRAALAAQGLDVLMVETDAPYLAPIPHRGQANEPAYVAHTALEAARILNIPLAELAARTTANAQEFFGLR
jgi:TatD DNase family protein